MTPNVSFLFQNFWRTFVKQKRHLQQTIGRQQSPFFTGFIESLSGGASVSTAIKPEWWLCFPPHSNKSLWKTLQYPERDWYHLNLAYRAAVTVTKTITIANIYEHLLSARDVFSPLILCGTTLGGTNYPDMGGNWGTERCRDPIWSPKASSLALPHEKAMIKDTGGAFLSFSER